MTEMEDLPSRLRYAVAGVGSVALGAYELNKGLPLNMLGLVANAWHNFGDGGIWNLRALALRAEGKRHVRLRRVAAAIMIGGSFFTLAETAKVASETPIQEYIDHETTPLLPPIISAGGNAAIAALVLAEKRGRRHPIADEAQAHVRRDRAESSGRAVGAAVGIEAIDISVTAYYGVYRGLQMGRDWWTGAEDPLEPTHEHPEKNAED